MLKIYMLELLDAPIPGMRLSVEDNEPKAGRQVYISSTSDTLARAYQQLIRCNMTAWGTLPSWLRINLNRVQATRLEDIDEGTDSHWREMYYILKNYQSGNIIVNERNPVTGKPLPATILYQLRLQLHLDPIAVLRGCTDLGLFDRLNMLDLVPDFLEDPHVFANSKKEVEQLYKEYGLA